MGRSYLKFTHAVDNTPQIQKMRYFGVALSMRQARDVYNSF